MVENEKKFYLYDRWFAYHNQIGDKNVYISIPKNASSQIKIEINRKTHEMTLFYLVGKKIIEKIEISDILESTVELHYTQEVCENIEINDNEYDNLSIELFTTIDKNSFSRECRLKFIKRNKKSNFVWIEPPFPLNEKININDMELASKKVEKFIDFASVFPMYMQKIKDIVLSENILEKIEGTLPIKEIIIPQELQVYDRIYHLNNITENKIVLKNQEDGIRNLEIKYDPITLSLLSVSLKIKDSDNNKGIIRIVPNRFNGVTVKYCSKKKGQIRIGNKNIKMAKIHSDIIFGSSSQKLENSISIIYKNKRIELLEHPSIKNNYTDGAGNLYVLGNSGYNTFYGIAQFAPGIFRSIENNVFKKKILISEKSI